ncbi:MAG: P13 family porin [Treponema sp.]|nr:P13 family porin [Treponema sp.]
MKKYVAIWIAVLSFFSVSFAWSEKVTQAMVDAKQAEVTRLQNELQNAQADAYQAYATNSSDLQQKQAKVNQLQSQLTKAQNEAYQTMQTFMQQQSQQTQQVQQAQVPVQNQTQSQPALNQQTQQNSGSGSDVVFLQVKNLLDGGLLKNEIMIAQLSPQLNQMQKMMLYSQYEKSAGGPFALNFFVGFGLGSAIQGDVGGTFFQLGFETFGWIMIIAGCSGDEIKGGAVGVGVVSMLIGQIYGWIRPFVFAKNYNKTLQNALNGGSTMMFSLAPIIDPINEQYGFVAKLDL